MHRKGISTWQMKPLSFAMQLVLLMQLRLATPSLLVMETPSVLVMETPSLVLVALVYTLPLQT